MKLRYYILATFIFLSGVFLSLQAFRFYRQQSLYHAQLEFNHQANLRLFLIEQRIAETIHELSSLKQFFLASTQVSKENFPLFVKHTFKLYPHLFFLGWIEKDETSSQQELSFADLDTFPLVRTQLFPFQLLVFNDENHPFFVSNQDYSRFLQTLKKSISNTDITFSEKIEFFQQQKKTGFFLFQPVFQQKEGIEQSNPENLNGVLVGLSDFEKIIGDVRSLLEPVGINITIEDLTDNSPQLIYHSPAVFLTDPSFLSHQERHLQERWTQSKIFLLDHRTWRLKASPTLEFIKRHQNPWNYWEVILVGILGSGLAASYFLILVNRHLLTEKEVRERTQDLATINQALKEQEKQLKETTQEAKTANLAKSEFLATISHELRTPLNAIIGFNQCLLMGMDGPLTKQQRDSLKKIEKSSFHLLSLINNILDFSKAEFKGMELELKTYNIVDIVHSCIEEIRPLALQKNLELQEVITHPSLPIVIDKGRIRQVLINLLGNAVKFTQKGFIKVILLEEIKEIEIHIVDTGIGLSAEEIDKIFSIFSQADSSITRKYGGTGLGLTISKRIVELHGGSISVVSEKGKGSNFIIKLPKKKNERPV